MVLDNRTFVAQNVSVYVRRCRVNASLGTESGGPPAIGGPRRRRRLGGTGTFGATREARATVRCLDSRVAYRAYFVTERLARGVDAHAPGARDREGEPVLGGHAGAGARRDGGGVCYLSWFVELCGRTRPFLSC